MRRFALIQPGKILLSLLLFGAVALAQLGPEASATLAEAQRVAAEARSVYAGTLFTIDQPLWREAIRLGEEALDAAPDAPEVRRFLADTYTAVGWNIRAWNNWLRLVESGEPLDEAAREGLSSVGNRLGYARYEAGDPTGALEFYSRVWELVPENDEALRWLGRINLELGQPETALPYWQALASRRPEDEGAQFFLNRTEQLLNVGLEAGNAFQTGLALYNEGRLSEALASFVEASDANPSFVDAYAWAGRTSLELGQPEVAQTFWERVLELEPEDERARYFIGVAEAQATWGVEAAGAFQEGLLRYDDGDLEAAAERFTEAVRANPGYKDAVVWAARVYGELGQPQRALAYWEQVLALDPEDERARYFRQLSEDQLTFGVDAASAFSQGLSNYDLARFDEAEQAFLRATDANPDYADAWAWLGRIAFDQANFAEAARYYERASDLEPDNEAYRFFAGEAARLAIPNSADGE